MTDSLFCLLQSLEDFGDEDDEDVDDRGYEEDNEDDQDYLEDKDERKEKKESGKLAWKQNTLPSTLAGVVPRVFIMWPVSRLIKSLVTPMWLAARYFFLVHRGKMGSKEGNAEE